MTDEDDARREDARQLPAVAAAIQSPHLDAADRLERVIDSQITTLNGIDDKAEHVTRLVGILFGIVFSLLSLGMQFDGVAFAGAGPPTILAFAVGIGSLILAMAAAIVTYLSSTFKTGLHQNVGYLLSDPEYETTMETHVRRVVGAYGYRIERNEHVVNTNSRRFRRALLSMLVGVSYLSLSAMLFIGTLDPTDAWLGFGLGTVLTLALGFYILSGRYLTIEEGGGHDE